MEVLTVDGRQNLSNFSAVDIEVCVVDSYDKSGDRYGGPRPQHSLGTADCMAANHPLGVERVTLWACVRDTLGANALVPESAAAALVNEESR